MQAVGEELQKYLPGWRNYFQLAETPKVFADVDRWIRHRIRALQLKQWKRVGTIERGLLRLGAQPKEARGVAMQAGRWWAGSGTLTGGTLNLKYMRMLGVPTLSC